MNLEVYLNMSCSVCCLVTTAVVAMRDIIWVSIRETTPGTLNLRNFIKLSSERESYIPGSVRA